MNAPEIITVNLPAERDPRTGEPTQGPAGPVVGASTVVVNGCKQVVGTGPSFWHQSHTGAQMIQHRSAERQIRRVGTIATKIHKACELFLQGQRSKPD